MLQGRAPRINGDGLQTRSFMFVADCVEGGASVRYMAPFSHDDARLLLGIELLEPHLQGGVDLRQVVVRTTLRGERRDTVVRLAPPLVIAQDDLDWALDRFVEVVGAVTRAPLHPKAA